MYSYRYRIGLFKKIDRRTIGSTCTHKQMQYSAMAFKWGRGDHRANQFYGRLKRRIYTFTHFMGLYQVYRSE